MARRLLFSLIAAGAVFSPQGAPARIEIMLMGQTRGVRPPPLSGERTLRGTPFGHMALYIESAVRDPEQIIRQARQGEPAGLVLTVDKELKGSFFTAFPRDEFFWGDFDPCNPPRDLTRGDIEEALARFDAKYGKLYRQVPGISGFGQDYAVLCIRTVWGLVYPTTRDEEARLIDFWREHCRDRFVPTSNNCVSAINRSLRHAGLTARKHFFRGYACYNSWVYWVRTLVEAGRNEKAPDGTYLRRDGTYVTEYRQMPSEEILPSGRPFNAWSLINMDYFIWISPRGTLPITGARPVDYTRWPAALRPASGKPRRPWAARAIAWPASQIYEFTRLWPQTFSGIWWLLTSAGHM